MTITPFPGAGSTVVMPKYAFREAARRGPGRPWRCFPPAAALAAAGTGAADPFAGQSFWWILGLVFVGGLGLNLTPAYTP